MTQSADLSGSTCSEVKCGRVPAHRVPIHTSSRGLGTWWSAAHYEDTLDIDLAPQQRRALEHKPVSCRSLRFTVYCLYRPGERPPGKAAGLPRELSYGIRNYGGRSKKTSATRTSALSRPFAPQELLKVRWKREGAGGYSMMHKNLSLACNPVPPSETEKAPYLNARDVDGRYN